MRPLITSVHAGLRPFYIVAGLVLLLIIPGALPAIAQDNEDCLICHEDPGLESEDGRSVAVDVKAFQASVHESLSCTDCHSQPADYDDTPHFATYRKVDCSECHDDAAESYKGSFHQLARSHGEEAAPACYSCHGVKGNPHAIQPLNKRSAEGACERCHNMEAKRYDGSVHALAAKQGKPSPGCVGCHPVHSKALAPSAGAINNLCVSCHKGAMQQVRRSGHMGTADLEGVISCASCHDVHATHKPQLDEGTLESCRNCHPGIDDKIKASVHGPLIAEKKINCLSCHRTHQISDAREAEDFGCGTCHSEEEKLYRNSAHRLARLRGEEIAATCADCHGGHIVLPATDPKSSVNHFNIPETCGNCHTDQTVITSDFVRLPINLPGYEQSIHGIGWKEGKNTAVCTDCHGDHHLQTASIPTSTINRQNLAMTCGQCHRKESEAYRNSVHSRALKHGVNDSPSCTDCHDEHLIRAVSDTRSAVNPINQASKSCGRCHEDPAMAIKFGLPAGVVKSYEDSYHGWAIKRGGKAVAVCMDCHNTHEIRSRLDPGSSIHPNNVVQTCGRCHDNSNAKFAASYTHILVREKKMVHDWVALVYWILIPLVLGGMFLHNLLIAIHELKLHFRKVRSKPAVLRMNRSEIWQHLLLAFTFIGLAITGFALRFPDAWWVVLLKHLGLTEELRRIIHRVLAFILVAASLYHVYYLVGTGRGRMLLRAMFPKMRDAKEAFANVGFYLGLRKKPPVFGMYDYTQKAEYWALIWGQIVMTISGLILMFPDLATSFAPAWIVRVAETFHFYEAILAVSAIVVWHFFFTIFLPKEYPMSWIWITGRMPKDQWKHHHGREPEETGKEPVFLPGETENGGKE